MPHGNSSQDTQPQPPKPTSGNDGDQQRSQKATPQSPAPSFAPAVSSPGPQSPGYQIQQLIMSRNPVPGQNVNITLQNVGPVVAGNQQITLTPLPLPNPASPGFQFSSQTRRFEHGSPSYIQVTSPISQQVQTQSPTQPTAVPIQALQGVRATTAGASLGMCSQSPTRGFVDAGLIVRQLSLGPSASGHFVFQEGTGITQIAQGAQVHLPSGTSTPIQARTLLHSNSQTVGSVQFGSQSPVTSGASHITTTNLPPQISSIIQGQLIQQQQQVLHSQQLGRTISFDRTSGGMIAGVAGTSTFGIASQPAPTSPSRAAGPAPSSLPLASIVKKQSKKLEEIPPATQEDARMRKQCLDHHHKTLKALKENFKDYMIELFFLQYFQGNMMDFLAFKKKPTIQLQNYLRQNDLDAEVEEEEGDKSSLHLNQPQDPPASPVSENTISMETQASSMQRETPIDAALKPLQDSSESTSHHLKVTLGISQTPPTQSKNVAMPPSETTVALPNHRQSDPTKVSTMPNSTSLQSPSRTQPQKMPITFVPNTLHPTQQQPPVTDAQIKGKTQTSSIPVAQSAQNQMSQQSQVMMLDQPLKPQQGSDPASLYAAPSSPATPASASDSVPPAVSPKRILSPGASRSPRSTESQPQENMALISEDVQQEAPVPKPLEQESHIHQRIAELRKEGLWSLRRLPKLQEASRPKSHWDYLLEEMQWMAADFAQERMWKVSSAKKLVRTAARYWQEKQQNDARAKKENEDRLRRIAWFAAREIQHFWYNIEQVVEIKLQVDLQTKRKKVFCTQRGTLKGEDKAEILVKGDESSGPSSSQTIKKADTPKAENDDGVQKQLVLIDSLLNIEGGGNMEQRKNSRDIAEVAAAAELLLPRGSSRITCTVKSSPPPLLHGSLREYQQIGLDWLAKQFKKNLNGILADETGLGKNVQVIALMAHLASKEGVWGPHLIVVRSCKLLKWELEFKRWCPALKLLLYFGSQRELRRKRQKWDEPNYFNVCITSYKQLFKGHKAFMKMRWKYLVMDEVHQIKNMTEKHWEAIFKLPSQRRLLLRDTPLPHTWKELWTMVHFLIPGLSRPYLDFPVKENRDQDQEYKHTISIRLHRTAQPFILRRSKRDVERQLTKKSEHVLKCQLSNRQRTLYEDVMMQPGTRDALKGGHFVSVLHVLMQLQKICNHPELVDPRPERSSYVCKALKYQTASLILRALEYDPWKNADLSMFDFLGMENKMTRYEAQVLPKQKVSRKLIQEIYSSPDPAPRPSKVQLKPSRLFEPVLYGQKPEGRMVAFPSSPATRTVTTTTSTGTQQGQVKRSQATTPAAPQGTKVPSTTQVQIGGGRPPATFTTAAPVRQMNQPHSQTPLHAVQPNVPSQRLVLSSQARLPSGEVVKIAQLAAGGGTQGRIAQPETPVTLQFQGNKFTLSQSQLRQLTAGQPLQLQGNVLQIVSAPGQYLRPQGSIVLPTMPQGTAANAVRSQQFAAPNSSAAPPAAAMAGKNTQTPTAAADQGTKPASNMTGTAQESTEDKLRIVKERLDRIFAYNELRCARAPLYGADLLSLCTLNVTASRVPNGKRHWSWSGSVSCRASSCSPEGSSDPLRRLILSPGQQKAALESLSKRSLCVVPAAVSAPPAMIVPHPPPSYTHSMKLLSQSLKEQVAPYIRDLRERTSPYCVQFPDVRLVQLDSGKLEALVILLKKLKSEGRRILIFSQMLHMLDILEVFLDFHSITFLRMDENANSDQCQDLIKSYNRDPRIFCMVLSTHVYAMSVPHIEADTVIFYDSDLNPVVDGKTQSWCDLIGRSKDIHVYRLVTANSVEEKLLRNGTKDLIREVAAQGSDYTLAFLTQQTIQELFEVCSPLEDSGFRVKAEEFVLLSQEPSPSDTITAKTAKPFVEALGRIERGTEEATEHIQEDGPQPNAGICPSDDCEDNLESSHLQELADLMKQLTPIEKYALHYLELSHIRNRDVHLGYIEEQLNAATEQWDSQHLRGLKEREKKMEYETEENEELLTYTREDAYNMDFIYDGPDGQTEIMPVWTPPTPPQDENDIYIDSVMCLMYDTSPIPESKLPPVYVRKERKRHRTDPAAAGRKKKLRHGESVAPPRSLFDRAAPNPLKVRKEGKEQKKNILLKQQTQFAKPLPTLIKPVMETGPDNPEWLISEDWALLQAVKQLLELPLNLAVVSPAHTPNWDLVSDVVNSCSRIYRSSKQCKSRYENVIIPREEGKLLYDASPKKKSENLFKNKPLRTSQIYTQDEGMSHSQLFTTRFDLMKMTAGKRSPPIKPLLGMNPFQKNPKHASVLAESGINYDKPLPPIQVASLRADRIAKEKKALVDQVRAQQQSGPVTQQPQQNGQQPAQSTSVQPAQVQAQTTAGTQQQVVLQQQPATKGPNIVTTTMPNPPLLTNTIKTAVPGTSISTGTVSGNVIVNTVSGVTPATFQPINKRLVSPVVTGTVSTAGTATTQIVQQRTAGPASAPTEIVTIATSQGVRAVTPVTGGTVVSTNLASVPSQARAIVTQVTTASTAGVQLAGKTITPAQFQLLRQPTAQVQVPQIQAQTQSPGQIKTVAKISSEHLLKLQKSKVQTGALTGTTTQVQVQPQQAQQLATVTASRAGAVLAGTTMTNLQVARLLQAQGQIQAQAGQTAQVALAKPPVVSAVVSSGGVTTLPVTVAGISVSINQPQKVAGGQTVMAQPLHVQPLLKLKQHHTTQSQQQQKTLQTQATLGQQKPYLSLQITTPQVSSASQQQKVTYTNQPAIKTQFLTTSLSQAQKAAGTQQVQAQIQVAKLPQVVQQQATIATLQQVVSASQQVQPQTVTLTQATAAGQQQVQVIPAGSAAAQVVHQKLLQQQVLAAAAAASPQIQAPVGQSPAQASGTPDAQSQQAKLQVRPPTVRIKAPTKPS